ncbi:hypothetical protein Tco_0551211 [Tanacetum coccineum]
MVFPRLDPGLTVLVDPDKPCTERKPVKRRGVLMVKVGGMIKGGIVAIVEGEAHCTLGLRGGLLGVQTQFHIDRIIISKLTYKLGGLLLLSPISFRMEPQLGLYVRLGEILGLGSPTLFLMKFKIMWMLALRPRICGNELNQFEKLLNASRAKKLEKSHNPLALVAHADPIISTMLLLAKVITQNFSNSTNNRLRASSNTKNQTIIQGDMVNIQSRNSGNTGRNSRRAYVQEEVVEGMNAPKETGNVQRTLRTPSSSNTSTDEAGIILTDEQNDFLFADASRMEEIEELSANICLMARIQPADHTSDDGPSYESAFISEVQSSSIDENNEPIGSVEKDTHVPDLCAVEKLARNAYQEAEKQQIFAQQVQKQNTHLTSQLEMYKERVRILENINKDNNYLNEFLEADERAKYLEAKLKKNVDLILKLGNSLQGMFMLGPKPLSVYDQQLKHGLGYPNPYTLKQAISKCLKLYVASSLGNLEIPLNVRDFEDTLEDAFKS